MAISIGPLDRAWPDCVSRCRDVGSGIALGVVGVVAEFVDLVLVEEPGVFAPLCGDRDATVAAVRDKQRGHRERPKSSHCGDTVATKKSRLLGGL